MRHVEMRQYSNGKVLSQVAVDIDSVSYFAISHVWGSAEWIERQSIQGIDQEILVSSHKAEFIRDRLPSLVGETPFWMDILCVDQRSKAARVAVVSDIPRIYSQASKTIAIRDGDGARECCFRATESSADWTEEGKEKFIYHIYNEHLDGLTESYLHRLWPLEELLLSNTVLFVTCRAWEAQRPHRGGYDPYRHVADAQQVCDSMYTAAESWYTNSHKPPNWLEGFIHAYLGGGSITRRPSNEEPEFSIFKTDNILRSLFQGSNRLTSKPRDFILAIMPRFYWYTRPSKAAEMSFQEFYIDLYNQSHIKNVGYIPKVTKSMTSCPTSYIDGWHPSENVPIPRSLGDFYKLFGGAVHPTKSSSVLGIKANHIVAYSLLGCCTMEDVLSVLRQSMMFSPQAWGVAHVGGELSRYGAWPSMDIWSRNSLERLRQRDRLENGDFADGASYKIEKMLWDSKSCEEKWKCLDYDFLVPEVTSILDALWLATYSKGLFEKEWAYYEKWLLREDPPLYKDTMLLLGALVSCELGLNAFMWAKGNFRPVIATIKGSTESIGSPLLGITSTKYMDDTSSRSEKFTVIPRLKWSSMQEFLSFIKTPFHGFILERLTRDKTPSGQDLVICTPNGIGVGLLPNFIEVTTKNDIFRDRLCALHQNARVLKADSIGLEDPSFLCVTDQHDSLQLLKMGELESDTGKL